MHRLSKSGVRDPSFQVLSSRFFSLVNVPSWLPEGFSLAIPRIDLFFFWGFPVLMLLFAYQVVVSKTLRIKLRNTSLLLLLSASMLVG